MTGPPRRPEPAPCAAALALILAGCQVTADSSGPFESEPTIEYEPSPVASAPSDPDPGSDPDQLSGLDLAGLTALLGTADFERLDGPAQILQYRNGICTLDLFLYRDSADETFRVAHVEARDPELRAVPTGDCLRSVRETRQGTVSRS